MGEVGEKLEGLESYLWVVSVDAGVAGGGPAMGAVLRTVMVAACGGAPVSGRRQGGHGRVQQGRTKVWALGGAAQRHVRASRGEQQHAGDGMTRERARKLVGTRRA